MAKHWIETAEKSVWKLIEDRAKQEEEERAERKDDDAVESQTTAALVVVSGDYLVVTRLDDMTMKSIRLKEITCPLNPVISTALAKPPAASGSRRLGV